MKKVTIPNNWAYISLFNFFIASMLGLIIRLIMNYPISFLNLEYLLHSHSHFVFYAWVTMALSTALVKFTLPKNKQNKVSYGLIFWILHFSSYGMLITFILQGYKIPSIVFSSIATFVFYWFAVIFIKDMRKSNNHYLVKYFSYIATLSFVISSFGPYFLAYFSATEKTDAIFVNGALYFYLHFQYDGWFTFALFALFLHWLLENKINFDISLSIKFFFLLAFSIFPGYALSIIGLTDANWVVFNSNISVLAQLIAIILLIKIALPIRKHIYNKLNPFVKLLWAISIISFIVKTIMQSLSIEPEITGFIFNYRPVVIGFLHLIFLCVISFFIFGYFIEKRQYVFSESLSAKIGAIAFVISVVLSEIILFTLSFGAYFSIAMPSFSSLLFYITIVISISLLIFLLGQKRVNS